MDSSATDSGVGAGDGDGAFHRTTSNTFITSRQYAELEAAPTETDRRVLHAIRLYLANETLQQKSQSKSIADPLVATVKDTKERAALSAYLTDVVMHRFGILEKAPREPPVKSKKARIQIDNILRRLRSPTDPAAPRTDPIEVHAAWHLRRIGRGKIDMALIDSLLFCAHEGFGDHPRVRELVARDEEAIWDFVLQNEQVLWNHRKHTLHLYPNQTDLLDILSEGQDAAAPCFVELASPPCTGKTLMAGGLAVACPAATLVFCCVSPGVYLHVARLWYYLGAWPTFVYGAHKIEPNFKVSRTGWDPRSPTGASSTATAYLAKLKGARAFIVDLNLCRWFLEQLPADRRATTILFLDEPTMGADGCAAFAHVPALLASILQSPALPPRVILSSATLPSSQDLDVVRAPWARAHPTGTVHRIERAILTSSISLIRASTGELILPHTLRPNVAQHMMQDVVLLKAYSGVAVHAMRSSVDKPPAFSEAGLRLPADLDLMAVRRYAQYFLLQQDQESGAVKQIPMFPPIIPDTLALGLAPHAPGQTLVVADDTEALARVIVDPLIRHRRTKQLDAALRARDFYEKQAKAQAERIKDPTERGLFEEAQEFRTPVTLVPDDLVIHTLAHLRAHGADLARFPREFVRTSPAPSTVRRVLAVHTEEWRKLAYLAGVVYTDARFHTQANNPLGDIMEEALQDAVPVAVVDRSWTYGTNTPASAVLVTDAAAATMSRNSLIQFVNRVCRGAGTHFGKAFLGDLAVAKLLGEDDGVEAETIRAAFEK